LRTLQQIIEEELSLDEFSFVNKKDRAFTKYEEVIIYIVGGATYEEHLCCQRFAKENGITITLGGNTIHNSKTFLTFNHYFPL